MKPLYFLPKVILEYCADLAYLDFKLWPFLLLLHVLCDLQTLIMGNRDVINEMSSTNASVLRSVLMLIDKYDLYGQVAYPKHHKQSDVPDIYRLAAKTKVTAIILLTKSVITDR